MEAVSVSRSGSERHVITITGDTFRHRDYLKSIGARWDADAKAWTHRRPSDADRAAIAALGLVMGGKSRPTPPMPGTGPQPAAGEPVARRLTLPPAGQQRVTPEHGNDMTYRGHFATKDTLAFFGFATLTDHVDFVRQIPDSVACDKHDNRNVAWDVPRSFAGTNTMQEALDLADNGWQEGSDKAAEVLEILSTDHARKRTRRHSVAGGSVNVGRMLAGNPRHMRHRAKLDGTIVKTLFVDGGSPAAINADNLVIRAAIVAALSDELERNGYSCEIVVVNCPLVRGTNTSSYQIATRVKLAGDKLNLSDVVFALGHPSYLRRLVFAAVATEENCRSIWSYMGTPSPLFSEANSPGRNELSVAKITIPQQAEITGKTLIERVKSIFPMIVPTNFPVQMDIEC